MVSWFGANSHGSRELTVASKVTVTQRSARSPVVAAAMSEGPRSRRIPNTFSHAIRYSGTSAKLKPKASSETASIAPMPKWRGREAGAAEAGAATGGESAFGSDTFTPVSRRN